LAAPSLAVPLKKSHNSGRGFAYYGEGSLAEGIPPVVVRFRYAKEIAKTGISRLDIAKFDYYAKQHYGSFEAAEHVQGERGQKVVVPTK
jgi:hypothetical protein